MTFAHPYLLGLIALIPVLAWLKGRAGDRAAVLYSSTQLVRPIVGITRSSAGRFLPWLRWLSLALLVVALARPRFDQSETRVTASGVDIVVALDLSSSMAAEDFTLKRQRVNRLVIAKDVLKQFIARRGSDRIGLVAFAGRPYVAAPPTLDHSFLLENLGRLNLYELEDGTAIGSAVASSLNRLQDLKSKSRIVIVMTDGQNNAGKVPPLTAADAAQALGVKVYTIGVGTRGEAPVPYTDVFGRRAYTMQKVDIDEKTLGEIAKRTGGVYYRADSSDTLARIYAEIDRLEKTEVVTKKYERYHELFPWAILAGLTVLLLESVLSHTVWRKLP